MFSDFQVSAQITFANVCLVRVNHMAKMIIRLACHIRMSQTQIVLFQAFTFIYLFILGRVSLSLSLLPRLALKLQAFCLSLGTGVRLL